MLRDGGYQAHAWLLDISLIPELHLSLRSSISRVADYQNR